MKLIKKIIGVIFLIISIFVVFVGIYGLFDNKIDVSSKIFVEFMILYAFLFFSLIGLKLLFNYSIFKNNTNKNKTDTNKNSNIGIKPNIKFELPKDVNTYIVEFPFYGFKVFTNDLGKEERKYYNGVEVYNWLSQDDIEGVNWSWNGNNMLEYITDKKLKKKISNISLFINKNGTCRVFIKVLEELKEDEKNQIINFISGQVSDVWGEGNFDYEDEKGEKFELSFWKNDGSWYIKYIDDELFEKFINMFKRQTEKECYKIDLIDETPGILDNKIGGSPYIPIEEEYPLDVKGNPMILLLQVNLKDIKLDGYPNDGIMEIFISQEYNYPYEYKIKYFKDNLKYKTDLPNVLKENTIPYIEKEYKIKLDRTIDYMRISDFRYWDVLKEIANNVYGINPDEYDLGFNNYKHKYSKDFDKIIYSKCPKISIGGYADFTQEDPRSYEDIADKTECIFKLDSLYDQERIIIGDVGILFALISMEDIKDKKFENIYVDYDCM